MAAGSSSSRRSVKMPDVMRRVLAESDSSSDMSNTSSSDSEDEERSDTSSADESGSSATIPRGNQQHKWVDQGGTIPVVPSFTGSIEVVTDTAGFTPVDHWKLFIDDDLINHMVYQTNLYVDQKLASSSIKPKCHLRYR